METINEQLEKDGNAGLTGSTIKLSKISAADLVTVLIELKKAGIKMEVSADISVKLL